MQVTVVDVAAIPTHVTTVVRTERLDERFVRVTFGGGLERFDTVGPDQFVYLLLPPPGRAHLTVGTDFRWTVYDELPEVDRPVGAYYTVRHHRPEAGELDCDVFLHQPDGAASRWAAATEAGASAALWGPRTAWAPPAGTERWLLVADETGVPALESILEHLPDGADVVAVVAASSPEDLVRLDHRVDVVPAPVGAPCAADGLLEAVRSLGLDGDGCYAWGGGESRAMRDVRRYLRRVVGMGRDQVSMTPYWRHPSTPADVADDGD